MKNFRRYFAWTLLSTMFLGGCLNMQIPTDTPPQVIVPDDENQTEVIVETEEVLNYMVEVE